MHANNLLFGGFNSYTVMHDPGLKPPMFLKILIVFCLFFSLFYFYFFFFLNNLYLNKKDTSELLNNNGFESKTILTIIEACMWLHDIEMCLLKSMQMPLLMGYTLNIPNASIPIAFCQFYLPYIYCLVFTPSIHSIAMYT